jgi:hypothetical protein
MDRYDIRWKIARRMKCRTHKQQTESQSFVQFRRWNIGRMDGSCCDLSSILFARIAQNYIVYRQHGLKLVRISVSTCATCATVAQYVAVVLLTLQLIYAPGEPHIFFITSSHFFFAKSVESCLLRLVPDNHDVCCHYFAYIKRDSTHHRCSCIVNKMWKLPFSSFRLDVRRSSHIQCESCTTFYWKF